MEGALRAGAVAKEQLCHFYAPRVTLDLLDTADLFQGALCARSAANEQRHRVGIAMADGRDQQSAAVTHLRVDVATAV